MENIGKKLKNLALAILIIGIAVSVIGGLILFSNVGKSKYTDGIFLWQGFAVLIGGIFLSIFSSFSLYGFGQLIESTQNLEKKFCEANNSSEQEEQIYNCPNCGGEIQTGDYTCKHCKTVIQWKDEYSKNKTIADEKFEKQHN
jgi:hypothetical protein